MKKIAYLLSSVVFFLFFTSNVYANKVYSVRVNYDTFSQVLESDSRYSTIIDYINNKLRDTGYYYYIESMRGNYNECNNSNKSQATYNNYCDLEYAQTHGGYRLRVVIINPSYYSHANPDTRTNDIPGFYFFINGGRVNTSSNFSGWFTFAPVGFSFGSDTDSDDTKLIRQPYDMPNGHTTHIIEFNSVNDLSNLDSWLTNPVFDNGGANFYHEVGYSLDNSGFPDYNPFNANFTPMFIYKNFRTECKYAYWLSTRYNNYFELYKNNMTYYKDGEVHTFAIDSDPEFILSESSVPIKSPIVDDLGKNNYSVMSYQIKIEHSSALSTINCPVNTEFKDGFCYTDINNYSSDSDLKVNTIYAVFDLGTGNNIPYLGDNYYFFTFRVDSSTPDLAVERICLYNETNGVNCRYPINVNKYNSGAYIDYQVVFQAPSGTDWAIGTIKVGFKPLTEIANPDYFSLGIFKVYTYKQFGTIEPTLSDEQNYYNNNGIDSVITNNDGSNLWFTNFKLADHGLSNFVKAPLNYIKFIMRNNNVCSSITLPTHYFGNINLPCMSSVIQNNLGGFLALYQVIISGLICYRVGLGYYRLALVTFNPTDSRIEVMDL